ncbi:MAG: GYF domain-containing protein [Planctomycetaceae bacterium]
MNAEVIFSSESLGAAMSARWYYQMLMEEFGPVTVQQLRELFEEGTLSDVDLVRCETDDVWTTVASLKPSVFAGAGARPELPMEEIGDLSELAFEFEDSGPTARRGAYPQESTEEAPPVSTGPFPGSLMQSPSPIAADVGPSVSSPRILTPQPPASDEHVEEWFCESLGQVLGPMSFNELIELGESGALDANDRVRCGQRGIWKTVDCLPSVMRAVAVGRAIELDPPIVSATTQKPPDEAASEVIVNATHAPVKRMAELPQQPMPEPQTALSVEDAATVQPQPRGTISEKPKATKSRPKRRKNEKGDDELLDVIFDDVFNDARPPVRSGTTAPSFAAASTTASAASSINIPTQSTPPTMSPPTPPTAAYSSPASQGSSRAAGAQLAAAAMAGRSSSRSSGRSFEANPATIGILVAVMLVAAGGWYVWQYGISFGSSNGNGSFDSAGAVIILEATMERYKAIGDNPSESEWNEFSEKTKKELSVLFKTVYDRAGATPKGAACLAATMCLMKIARIKPGNKEFVDRNLAEYERQIALVKK